jgi:two-component system phosphate regulon sensor histidine kinase PhoR
MFSLTALLLLGAETVGRADRLHARRSSEAYVARFGRLAAAVEMAYVRGASAAVGDLLRVEAAAAGAAYCGIVDGSGRYARHSGEEGEGTLADAGNEVVQRWGAIAAVRLLGSGQGLLEFRTPLSAADASLGELRMGVPNPLADATWLHGAERLSVAYLMALGLLAIGALLVGRQAEGLGAIEEQLRRTAGLPQEAPVALEPVRACHALSVGWNRVVDALTHRTRQAGRALDLQEHLDQTAATQQQMQYEAILRNLAEGVAVTDVEGRVQFANAAVAALLDDEPDPTSLLGAALTEQLEKEASPESRVSLRKWVAADAASAGPLQVECDAERTYHVERSSLDTPDGGYVWLLRDVSQQRLAQQSRDQFIDTATHELRTPLANIKAYAEMLASADDIDVEHQKEFCNVINAEVTRLARFVDDLLSISSLEVGTLTIDARPVELGRLFDEVVAKVRPLMEQKSLAFSTTLPPKLPEAKIDKDKIAAVLVNLLGNAAKYTPATGRVALRVSAEEKRLRIAVEDSGVGVAAEELPKLFDKFFRSSDPRVQAETGTGLGLSLAREVVRVHGGEIRVESVLNEGSTFIVELPLA